MFHSLQCYMQFGIIITRAYSFAYFCFPPHACDCDVDIHSETKALLYWTNFFHSVIFVNVDSTIFKNNLNQWSFGNYLIYSRK